MDYQSSKAWPYVEARKLAERNISGRDAVLETGFGPSGWPTIATFCEVARTTMVRRAYEDLMGYGRNQGTRLIVFSDDCDALRKVPDTVSHHRQMMEQYIGVSLARVPDPFGRYESFAHHNNARLREFLDSFEFDYEFISATDYYNAGVFDDTLRLFASRVEDVKSIILPTLGPDRRQTYNPFMPIDPETGRVFEAGVIAVHDDGSMVAEHPDFGPADCLYTGGGAKLQWKADWAMRWIALGVDYEMAGKDLTDSVRLSSAIVRKLGHTPPVNMIYEMFLDEHGKKISKSLGNGLTMDDWLRYGTPESLSYYLFRDPQRAKKLFPAVVPQAMDDYWDARARYTGQTEAERLGNPVHHVHGGAVPPDTLPVTYQLLLNLAATASVEDMDVLMRYLDNHFPLRNPTVEEDLRTMAGRALDYYLDHSRSHLNYRGATTEEAVALGALANEIEEAWRAADENGETLNAEKVQFIVYEIGKEYFGKEKLRDWFRTLYQTVLGQDSGPRFGAFAVLFGVPETVKLLREIAHNAE